MTRTVERFLCGIGILILSVSCSKGFLPVQPTSEFPIATELPTAASQPAESHRAAQETAEAGALSPEATEITGVVSIWHSWDEDDTPLLIQIVQAFQMSYPGVSFDLLYLPKDELFRRFEAESYRGEGPVLILGPSDWGSYLLEQNLVENLSPYISDAFQSVISAPSLEASSDRDAIFGIPYAQNGILLFRNKKVIANSPGTFGEMVKLSKEATLGGVIGSYLDQGAYFSLGHLYGLGGSLMDAEGNPALQKNDYREALQWVALLSDFKQAGAVEINGSQHLALFKEGKVGFMIDGSWRLRELAQAVGAENLAVDPWPEVGQGRMSGFIQAEVLYANSSAKENSPQNFTAGLYFIGYMLTPQVQGWLANAGFLPVRLDFEGGDALALQAVTAMRAGVAYPARMQNRVRTAYFDEINFALIDIFQNSREPKEALQDAQERIAQRLIELRETNP